MVPACSDERFEPMSDPSRLGFIELISRFPNRERCLRSVARRGRDPEVGQHGLGT